MRPTSVGANPENVTTRSVGRYYSGKAMMFAFAGLAMSLSNAIIVRLVPSNFMNDSPVLLPSSWPYFAEDEDGGGGTDVEHRIQADVKDEGVRHSGKAD
jgi:hypothetical protein